MYYVATVSCEGGLGLGLGGVRMHRSLVLESVLIRDCSVPLSLAVDFDHFHILRAIGKGAFGKVSYSTIHFT